MTLGWGCQGALGCHGDDKLDFSEIKKKPKTKTVPNQLLTRLKVPVGAGRELYIIYSAVLKALDTD